MKYVISSNAYNEIETFYTNMWKKFHNEWGLEEIHRLIDRCVDAMFEIEKSLPQRNNILKQWEGFSVAEFKLNRRSSWFFAYKVVQQDNKKYIYVEDACHSQNIHDHIESNFENFLSETINRYYLEWYNLIYQ